jgi:hypothetical protein
MLYLYIHDNISKQDILSNNLIKSQAIVSSVGNSSHGFDVIDGKLDECFNEVHRAIRYRQFQSFAETARDLADTIGDLHLKYGGLCFLNDGVKERFTTVKRHLDFIVKHNYSVDHLHNDILLNNDPLAIMYDRFILRRIFETKETGLIFYRPQIGLERYNGNKQILDLIKNATNEEIKQCPLLRKVF